MDFTMKPTKWRFILIYFYLKLLQNAKAETKGDVLLSGCGFPGRPASGNVIPRQKFYEANQKITYKCDSGYVIEGPNFNICKNNTWENDVPLCHLNVAFFKTARQAGEKRDNPPAGLAVDDNQQTCSKTDISSDPWWSVDLEKTYAIKRIVIKAQSNVKKFQMRVQVLRFANDSRPMECGFINTSGPGISRQFDLSCNPNVTGRIVRIDDERPVTNKLLTLCDVQVITKNVTISQWPCGEPSLNPYCQVNYTDAANNIQTANYFPSPGYRIEGNTVRSCRTARWEPSTAPQCIPIPNYKPETPTNQMKQEKQKTDLTTSKPVESNFIIGVAIGVTAASISTVVVIVVVICIMKKYYRNNRNDATASTFSDNSAVYIHSGGNKFPTSDTSESPPVLLYSNPWDDPSNHVYDYIDLDSTRKSETSPLTPTKKILVDNLGYLMHRNDRMGSNSSSNKSRTGSSSTRCAGGSTSTASVQESLLSIGDTDTLPIGSEKNSPGIASSDLDDIYRFPEE